MTGQSVKSISASRALKESCTIGTVSLFCVGGSVVLFLSADRTNAMLLLFSGLVLGALGIRLARYSYWASRQSKLENGLLEVNGVNGQLVALDLSATTVLVQGLFGEVYKEATGGYALVGLEGGGRKVWLSGEQYHRLAHNFFLDHFEGKSRRRSDCRDPEEVPDGRLGARNL